MNDERTNTRWAVLSNGNAVWPAGGQQLDSEHAACLFARSISGAVGQDLLHVVVGWEGDDREGWRDPSQVEILATFRNGEQTPSVGLP